MVNNSEAAKQYREKHFDIDYFIEFFSDIDENEMGLSTDDIPSDAWEWLQEEEADCLYDLIQGFGILLEVNDGDMEWSNYETSPKRRVLKFLKQVKLSRQELLI